MQNLQRDRYVLFKFYSRDIQIEFIFKEKLGKVKS